MNTTFQSLVNRYGSWLFIALLFAEGIHLRNFFFGQVSGDMTYCLLPWIDYIHQHGTWGAFRDRFSDYAPLYLHMLALSSAIFSNPLFAVKFISWVFDLVALRYLYGILCVTGVEKKQALFYTALFWLLPTLVLNGSTWGQCDVVYGSMVLGSFYYLLKKSHFSSFLLLGIAFSLKLQAIFIFPLFFLYFLFHRQTWKYFFLVPAVYLVTIVPSLLAGRGFTDLLCIYIGQTNSYSALVLNTTTIYNLFQFPVVYPPIVDTIGISVTAAVLLMFCFFVFRTYRKNDLDTRMLLRCALWFSLAFPFFLPHMHERYFFLADLFSILYIMTERKNYFVAVIINLSSLVCYISYLYQVLLVSRNHLSFLMLLVLVYFTYICLRKNPVEEGETSSSPASSPASR